MANGVLLSSTRKVIEVIDTDYDILRAYRDLLVVMGVNSFEHTIKLNSTGNKEGDRVTVKDRYGTASQYPITVVYGAGNIDNLNRYAISTNYGSLDFVWNNGQWWLEEPILAPSGEYAMNADQTAPSATTTDIYFEVNDTQTENSDVDLVSNGTGFSIFKANTNGWYEVDLTTSFKNTAVAPHEVYVCINRDTGSGFNGLPIRSNRMRLGPSGGSDEKPLTLKTNVYLYAGWRIKAAWWTDDSGVVMKQYNSPDTGISDVPSARMIIRKYSEANEQSGN
jgi:hypothetical protein